MAAIFENKYIESNDTDRMKFPSDANWDNLPPACRSLNPGQSEELTVYDDGGTPWKLTIENKSGQICFTKGWQKLKTGKGIKVGHKISLYKDDDYFGEKLRLGIIS